MSSHFLHRVPALRHNVHFNPKCISRRAPSFFNSPWAFCRGLHSHPHPSRRSLVGHGQGSALNGQRRFAGDWDADDEESDSVIEFKNVTKTFGGARLLDTVSFKIQRGDRATIVGPNGHGKSTLAALIMGHERPDGGDVVIDEDADIGFLPQDVGEHVRFDTKQTLVGDFLSDVGAPGDLLEQFRKALKLPKDTASLLHASGGQKTKLLLTKILLNPVHDILLLDEPTNNLDASGSAWLAAYLAAMPSDLTSVVITHDRFMLEGFAKHILELKAGNVKVMEVENYVKYLHANMTRMSTDRAEAAKLKASLAKAETGLKEIRQLLTKEQKEFDKKVSSGEVKESIAERGESLRKKEADMISAQKRKIEQIQKQINELDLQDDIQMMALPFKAQAAHDGRHVLKAANVTQKFGDTTVFKDLNFEVTGGERVIITGPNGAGKTTLLRTLVNEIAPTAGRVSVMGRWGFMSQQQDQDLSESVKTYLGKELTEERAMEILSDVCALPVTTLGLSLRDLSTGQRRRLQFGRMVAQNRNLIVLDEPTNHLDLVSKEALESCLSKFQATLIAASHDTYFAERVGTRILRLENGVLTDVTPVKIEAPEAKSNCREKDTLDIEGDAMPIKTHKPKPTPTAAPTQKVHTQQIKPTLQMAVGHAIMPPAAGSPAKSANASGKRRDEMMMDVGGRDSKFKAGSHGQAKRKTKADYEAERGHKEEKGKKREKGKK